MKFKLNENKNNKKEVIERVYNITRRASTANSLNHYIR